MVELLEQHDCMAQARNAISKMAEKAGEWAGIPLPIEGEQVVVEPSYPFAYLFNECPADNSIEPDDEKLKLRNTFWSTRYRLRVHVVESADGKVRPFLDIFKKLDYELRTLGCSYAWGVEQESNALQLLGTLVRHHAFKQYLLSGMFLETSKRSGVTYLFRKLRPTVALRPGKRGGMKILACLCMHPIAYYHNSWAGAMCPTDDVIAHLQMMRADEVMFWKRCSQHPAYKPESGL